jgi:hypothetical protein
MRKERVMKLLGIRRCTIRWAVGALDRYGGGKCCESGDGEECGLHVDVWMRIMQRGAKRLGGEYSVKEALG